MTSFPAHRSTVAPMRAFWSSLSKWSPILSRTANVAATARIAPTATADVGILLSSMDRLGQIGGVCMNKDSPRAGLLTFEHQGCPAFEVGADREELPG